MDDERIDDMQNTLDNHQEQLELISGILSDMQAITKLAQHQIDRISTMLAEKS